MEKKDFWEASLLGLIGTFLSLLIGIPITLWNMGIFFSLVFTYVSGFYEYLYVAARTFTRDARGFWALFRLKLFMTRIRKHNLTIPQVFAEVVQKHPSKTCIFFEEKKWTFKEVDEEVNRVAHTFWKAGFREGDVAALFMESQPEYLFIWLGLARIGVVTALINSNLRREPLAHSIKVSQARALIFGTELSQAVEDILDTLPTVLQYYHRGDVEKAPNFESKPLDALLKLSSATAPPSVQVHLRDRVLFIYTSGTSGLPKAAIITHSRYIFMATAIQFGMGFRAHDIVYNSLPLYHNNGVMLGAGQAILHGNTVVIRRKFSASKFVEDCIRYKCTVAIYIGEVCRYLLAQPPKAEDRAHSIRLMYGNGLRPQIWKSFTNRFGIPKIGEFYGATEGNVSLGNIDSHVGACGFLSRIAPTVYPCTLIKIDEQTGTPIRDKNGVCIKCQPGEAGELVGKILQRADRCFDGYVDKVATEKKILRDVFHKGDMAFSSGDILVMDRFGYLYFKDRRGDTFRWKGENVSTMEVEAVVSNASGLRDSIVYGVEVPGCDGRAGMAAILDPSDTLDLKELARNLQQSLPSYAIPIFIRIIHSLPITGTFKFQKTSLQQEGFNPSKCHGCDLFFLQRTNYCPLDDQAYMDICNGKIRL